MTTCLRVMVTATIVATVLAGCGDDDDGGTPDGGQGGAAPVITQVRWMPVGSCSGGASGDYMVTTTITDADTADNMLTLSGTVSSCTPFPFSSRTQVIRCPNQSPYTGSITVTDPQNNRDTQAFTITPCVSGMAP